MVSLNRLQRILHADIALNFCNCIFTVPLNCLFKPVHFQAGRGFRICHVATKTYDDEYYITVINEKLPILNLTPLNTHTDTLLTPSH